MRPSVDRIIDVTCEQIGCSRLEFLARRREFARERGVAMFLAREMTGASYPEIGRAFGRHHSTAIYGVNRATRMHAGQAPGSNVTRKLIDQIRRTVDGL